MERRIELHLRLSYEPRALRPWLALGLMLLSAGELGSENVTLTTYYPAPSGMYTQLVVTGNTQLARNSSSVAIGGSDAVPAVKLTVGDNHAIKLGAAYLSSGGDFAHLANNGWHKVGSVPAWQSISPGALIQLTSQDVNFYKHAAGVQTPTVSITANGALRIARSAVCGAARDFTNGQSCPAGDYATFTPGLYTEGTVYQNLGGPVLVETLAGGLSTQVWGLDNCGAGGTGCTGNPRWMTLKKDNSTARGYCCTK